MGQCMSSNYSLSVFSRGGRIPQVNHAITNVTQNGKLVVGIKARNGIVIAQECKPNSDLIILKDNVIRRVTDYIAVAFSGMDSDFNILITAVQKKAERYLANYGEPPAVRQVASWISRALRNVTQENGRRVSALAITVGGWDSR